MFACECWGRREGKETISTHASSLFNEGLSESIVLGLLFVHRRCRTGMHPDMVASSKTLCLYIYISFMRGNAFILSMMNSNQLPVPTLLDAASASWRDGGGRNSNTCLLGP